MTPLSRLIGRWLPTPLHVPALALIYAAMIAAILVLGTLDLAQIIYVDVRGA